MMLSQDWFVTFTAPNMNPTCRTAPWRKSAVYADAGYTGVEKSEEYKNRDLIWQIAARRRTYSS
ncbi:Mobile element protein [Pseudomonas savastanoi]|uniref:Mobile element protein n=1 Tax=Pseudomonas savastanoi TaxID=29438 RepID=A0A3M5ZPX3_PSESS|nr:Mobile element protein [Pseudomonas savastanoi]